MTRPNKGYLAIHAYFPDDCCSVRSHQCLAIVTASRYANHLLPVAAVDFLTSKTTKFLHTNGQLAKKQQIALVYQSQ
jgi:hypothetical protein